MNPAESPISGLSPAPYAAAANQVVAALGTDSHRGLTSQQARERLATVGPNQLSEIPATPLWKKFAGQFQDLVIWILIVAAIVSGALGEWADTQAILAIVLLNGILGFLQEERAERALSALQQLSAPVSRVIRDGVLATLPARELVPGDLIGLEAGDNIPADARLLEAFGFRAQEASLTGESTPVEKDAACVLAEATPLGDRRNLVLLGTVAAAGKASAVVVGTGMNTELGRIAGLLQRYQPEPTPLQRRLAELGRVLVVVCLSIVGIIFILQLLRGGNPVEVFLLSVSLAVAAVPEGLPAVVTLALALGLQRMVKRNVLVRKLPSVETLGSVTVICSDKTGTLTRNEMTVRALMVGDSRYEITGVGYVPRGEFRRSLPATDAGQAALSHMMPSPSHAAASTIVDPRTDLDLIQALTIAARCNNTQVSPANDGSGQWRVVGDPTEGALLVAALKAGVESDDPLQSKIYELPFDSQRKAMSVVFRGPDRTCVMYTKGAPEVILAKCTAERRGGRVEPLDEDRRRAIINANADLAQGALRVLAVAYRELPDAPNLLYEEQDLVFSGLIGMIDPPREEVKDAVRKCRDAGIRPVMITGDHPGTALAIARELEMTNEDDRVVTGAELSQMSTEELAAQVDRISVYARVSAEHKLQVIEAWKRRGHVVAMTGDGVNDAPAVKAADIGIAMGIGGTDVTKEASDMVLTDDNFASIVNAVEEGRGIFDNIQKFVHYLLACNTGEVLFMFFAALVAWPVPLVAIQILWINLVTDGLPALALAMEPPERDVMRRRPRPPREPVITLQRGLLMLFHGTLVAGVAVVGFAMVYGGNEASVDHARTVAFCIMAYSQLFFSFACRSQRYTLPELGLFSNPYLFGAIAVSGLLQLSVVALPFARPVFEISGHPGGEWLLVFLLSLTPVTIVEVIKLVTVHALGSGRGR